MIDWTKEKEIGESILSSPLLLRKGKIHSIQEQYFVSKGPKTQIGDICLVGDEKIMCEVISIEKGDNILLPFLPGVKPTPGDWVEVVTQTVQIPKLENLLGKVINANGEVINGDDNAEKKAYDLEEIGLDSPPIKAFEREEISDVFATGIRAIDGLLTIGIGQKIGIFAGSGVGKSTLLGMIAKNAKADINVIGLVGERGREVKAFIKKELGEEGMKRSVLVVATSDESHLMQLRAAKLATSIAEKFRDKGNNVLLMMDSITRFADARRNIDIATKEFPIGGKTLLMESYMKKLLERSGKTKKGSITGIYTVLVDGDDFNGPIPDLARGILDGHILLSRHLVSLNHYPAIDVSNSISRVMEDIVTPEHKKIAQRIRSLISLYEKNENYFKLGTIVESEETQHIFEAKKKSEGINEILKQGIHDSYDFAQTMMDFSQTT